MLTSQNGCQFSMLVFFLCCSLCTPEGETSFSEWPTKEYEEFTIDDLPPSDNLISLPLSGIEPPHLLEKHPYKFSNSESRPFHPEDKGENTRTNIAFPSSTLNQQDKGGVPQGGPPLDLILREFLRQPLVSHRPDPVHNQNYRREGVPIRFLKDQDDLRDRRDDWADMPAFQPTVLKMKDSGSPLPTGDLQKQPAGKAFSEGMLSSLISENMPHLNKRIFVKKRLPARPSAIKKWWGNYYRPPRPQMDRRAAQSKHYGCLKRCISAGKLHPIQCHTLC